MSYLERLKSAKAAIGVNILGPYVLLLAKNPNVRSEAEIKALLDSNGGRYDQQQLKAMALMVARANQGEEPVSPDESDPAVEPKVSPDPVPTEAPSAVPEQWVAEQNPSTFEVPEASDAGTQAPQESIVDSPTPVEPVALEPEPEETLDPARFMEIDALSKPARPVEIEISDGPDGPMLTWPASKSFKVFAVASNEEASPKSLARAAWYAHTTENSISAKTDHDFFSLFGFKGQDKPGVLLGVGRRLREVTRLQVEEFQSQIRLIWTVEDQGANVVLYKSQPNQSLSTYPSADRIVARSVGDGSFVDEAVSPGEDYEYRACVQWEGPSRVQTTAGKSVTAGVFAPVPQIENFQVESIGDAEVEITFVSPPEPAKVRLFQVRGLPQPDLLAAHQDTQERDIAILSGDNLPPWLGTEIIADAKRRDDVVSVRSPMLSGQIESRTYIGVAILGRRFRVMALRAIPQVGPISEMELTDRYDYQILRVATPPGAQYLEVWVAGESAKFEQISKLPPDRQVQIIDEYRKFGGIVFSDDLQGIVGASNLGSEPREIFVRGATNFEGVKHFGPVSSISHKGQIAVRYSRKQQAAQPQIQQRGMFGKKQAVPASQPTTFFLGIQASAPNRFGGVVSLQHLAGPTNTFPLDVQSPGVRLMEELRIIPNAFEVEDVFRDEQGRTRILDPNARHRLRFTDQSGAINGFPTFAVDTMPDNFIGFRQGIDSLNAELNVVILGSKQSGKTTYVQALLNYLKHQFASLYVAKLMPGSNDSWAEKRLDEMEDFVTKGILPPATRTAKPFFENPDFEDPNSPNPLRVLQFEIDNGNKVPLRRLGLVDVAGEDMDELETMRYYEASIAAADLIILLADPLQLGPVQNAMAGLPLPPRGTDPHVVLKNLNTLLETTQLTKNPRQRIAVVFSKFDGFQKFSQMEASAIPGAIQSGMAITRDPNSFSARLYNDADGALVQQEILSIMNQLDLASFIKLLENTVEANRRRFFVASSLGHASHSDVMDAAGLTSWRISDPIRWALHNL